MRAGNMSIRYNRSFRFANNHVSIIDYEVDDPMDRYNYLHTAKRFDRDTWRVVVGHRPSISHHRVVGDYDTAEHAIAAAIGYLKLMSYEKGTREYVETYRDRWLPGIDVLDEMPDGWSINKGAVTAPVGAKWICNGKSLFGGEYEHALLFTGR